MSLRLVIEHSPCPQPQTERVHLGGDLSIGRGADCDWQIDDPEMYVSRRHCIVTVRDGRYGPYRRCMRCSRNVPQRHYAALE